MGNVISAFFRNVFGVFPTGLQTGTAYKVQNSSTLDMKVRRLTTHTTCINNAYQNGPQRTKVPNDKIAWSVAFPDYKPVTYTASPVKLGPVWADKDISSPTHGMKFNTLDGNINRVSYYGEYAVENGYPKNPVGRTGMCGRGLLGKWGPNHAADPVVTRWKRDSKGEVIIDSTDKKPILQFVGIKRKDTGEIAIPGGMVEAGDDVSITLKKEFGEEALNSMSMTKQETDKVKKELDDLFKHGITLYKGYVDDPRNTDNAWMETAAVNFHDNDHAFDSFKLHAGDDAGAVYWIDIDEGIILYANHKQFIEAAASINKAHW